jgi:hypothetical protein
MAVPDPKEHSNPVPAWRKHIAKRSVILALLGVVLSLIQGCAASWSYAPERQAGLPVGVLHGVLLPAALPALLLGKDVPIYAPNTTGRPYKIGYILGLNLCGTVFFGAAFWRPPER